MDFLPNVVATHGDTAVFFAVFPLFIYNIVFIEHRQQMIGMFFAYILHTKIVHIEGKADEAPLVGSNIGCLVALRVPVNFQPFLQKMLG